MKIRIYSDLHLEFHPFEPPALDGNIDVVILAGDIDKKARGIKWANDKFLCPVVYVAGNHEFYDGHMDRTLRKMRDAAGPHVHLLENQSVITNGSGSWVPRHGLISPLQVIKSLPAARHGKG